MRARGSAFVLLLVLAITVGYVGRSAADDAPNQRAARAEFETGMKAFQSGKYLSAAEHFEQAYLALPHPDTLYNAALAWQRAGVLDRSANDYARYLREAPTTARDREKATAALGELRGALGRFEIRAAHASTVSVDHKPLAGSEVFVSPGTHSIDAVMDGGGQVSLTRSIAAGADVTVDLESPAPAAPTSTAEARTQAREPGARNERGWPPSIVFVGVGLTALATGATIWSGVDTVRARHSFDASPSQASLDDGRAKQSRTNVLFYSSVGLALLTATAAIWFVDWHGTRSAMRVGVGPGSLLVRAALE
jgi:hypothetical protein